MFSSLTCTSHIEWLSLGRSPGRPDDAARCSIFQENIKFHQIFPSLSSGTHPASGEVQTRPHPRPLTPNPSLACFFPRPTESGTQTQFLTAITQQTLIHRFCYVSHIASLRVYGTPLLNGEFLFAPVTREYSVQMFLEGIEYEEKLVLFYMF